MNRRKVNQAPLQSQDKDTPNPITKVESKVKNALTVLWSDLATWQQDNHYIHSGYRPASNSFSRSFSSILYLHNESVNIWTHLLGAIFALISSIYFYSTLKPRYERATTEDLIVFGCFFAGAVACLGMSATFHTISNHSEKVSKVGNQLDYVGIVCLIWGSFIPSIFYAFAREPVLVVVYWTMITLLGIGCTTVSITPSFRTPQWRPFRAGMFVAMGLSAVVPVLHGIIIYGVDQLERQMGLSWLVLQGLLYVTGAGLYAARFPERMKPGSFDIWGSSHQIFHVLVVLAAASHLIGLIKAFDYEHSARAQADNIFYGFGHMFGTR